ncbi:hypothetical protein J2I47_22255 [Fibrella sp. HMF5335]|uniref:Cytochrome b561 domain-containing protein n=1 Tax=Fibrella rubiginis TaxID=2817060 RepID=A0A939K6W4_9BACT|nr:hypothetical protein [Fibrella rubiginis]MBO0939293.1 hypothetical protein [Fibrella rubiginis]
MRIFFTLLLIGCFALIRSYAQTAPVAIPADTAAPVTATNNLLADLVDSTEQQPLLPHKMIFTQRVFWGPKGLLRVTDLAPLTAEGRAKELKIRRTMLVGHQVMGFVTLAGFVAQGIVGAKLYNATGDQYSRLLNVHSALATGVNVTYTTTALLSLTAPPKMLDERRGLSSIKLHKYLAMVHIAGMIATNVLAGSLQQHPELKPYHRAAAYTTFGAFALSIIAIKI